MSSRPPVAFQSGGGVARCRAGQKRKCRRGSKTPPWRRKGELHSCPKDSLPHKVNNKTTCVAPSSMMIQEYILAVALVQFRIVCRSKLLSGWLALGQQPMLGGSWTGMEIFYLRSRCCRRRANAKQPLLVLAKPGPHPAEISQWPLLVPFDTYPDRYHLQYSYKGNQEHDNIKVILVQF